MQSVTSMTEVSIDSVPNNKSRNIPEVVVIRRGAGGVLGVRYTGRGVGMRPN